MIKFLENDFKEIKNFKDGDGTILANMFINENIKIMKGILRKNSSVGYHIHSDSCEVIYILNGKVKCILDDKIEYLNEGEVHYCPKGSSHSVINESNEDVVMICVIPNQ